MDRINFVLQRNIHSHLRWLICGLIFCCCSMGISLWPVIYLNKGVSLDFYLWVGIPIADVFSFRFSKKFLISEFRLLSQFLVPAPDFRHLGLFLPTSGI
ncbi:unnamed protein product [Meloidogyne enterolobii]|uniref:Uncharacterized protein n=1 Tax=Meloidogyne enterolobii TaxID=390850 RepID=A0ACB0Z4Y0_MELEN